MIQTLQFAMTKEELQTLIHKEMLNAVLSANQQITSQEEIITHEKAEEILGLSRMGLYSWRRSGKIPYHKIGKRIYFKRTDIDGALKRIDLSQYNMRKG